MKIFRNQTEMIRFYTIIDQIAEAEECVFLLEEDRFVFKQATLKEPIPKDMEEKAAEPEIEFDDYPEWYPGMIKN